VAVRVGDNLGQYIGDEMAVWETLRGEPEQGGRSSPELMLGRLCVFLHSMA
jgi:hypothetical protein